MYIDRILVPIETLGPGKRLVIWTKGCSKHCRGCANPELWDTAGAKNYSIKDVLTILQNLQKEPGYDGITISGGDPLEQKEEILALLETTQEVTKDILVYTGYTIEEIEDAWDADEVASLKKNIAVLIDGPYLEEENREDVVLRGSGNQRILYFKKEYIPVYEDYLKKGRKIQNVFMGKQMVSVGIHNRKGDNF